MEQRSRTDNFWKVFSVILLLVMVSLVGVIVWQGKAGRPAFYESAPKAQSHLAALSPALQTGSDRYWVSDLAEKALPYVVNIETKMKADHSKAKQANTDRQKEMLRQMQQMMPFGFPGDPNQGQGQDQPDQPEPDATGVGSGFIVRQDGYIVTNAHVVDSANDFTVHFYDGKALPAKLVGKDDFKDIAVLKVNASNLPVAKLGNSDNTRIGEPVIAIGSPIGFQATVTAGIISSNKRSVDDLAGPGGGMGGGVSDIRKPQMYLQTDAAINRGNSGGPLINADGEVIGVNQAIARRDQIDAFNWIPIEGIGFAIPIEAVKASIKSIVETGSILYPGISAQIESVKDYVDANQGLKLDATSGVYVVRVTIHGPADKAGIKAGDVIESISGTAVADAKAFISQINSHKVGDRVNLRVARQGGKQLDDVSVVLEALDLSNIPKPGE